MEQVVPDKELAPEVEKLDECLRGESSITLLDVREPWEVEICKVEAGRVIPMGELAGRISELPKDQLIAVMCHRGGRSARAVLQLRKAGYQAVSVKGGIDAWAQRIEPGMARYEI